MTLNKNMSLHSFPLIWCLICILTARAQVLHDSSYFPLAVGNQWIYRTLDSVYTDTEMVADTQRVNGRLYYGFTHGSSSTPYLWFREDGDKIYIAESVVIPQDSTDIQEYLMYNFSAQPWESWHVSMTYFPLVCDYGGDIAMERIVDSIVTPAGIFRNCPVFSHRSSCRDAGICGEFFAAGIGRIQINRVTYFGGVYLLLTNSTLITEMADNSNSLVINDYHLFQNYPNPFNPTTTIVFQIPHKIYVTLEIYNVVGQKVKMLVNSELKAGQHSVLWNASDQTSGIYFCIIRANNFSKSIKLVLLH